MNAKSIFPVIAAALSGGWAFAIEATQLPEPANTTTTPAHATETPMDCTKAPVKRHDHGAERGLGVIAAKPMTVMPCDMERGAARVDGKADKLLRHDHGRFHKNQ